MYNFIESVLITSNLHFALHSQLHGAIENELKEKLQSTNCVEMNKNGVN